MWNFHSLWIPILKYVTCWGKLLSMCNCIYQHTFVKICLKAVCLVGEEGSSKNSCGSCKQLPIRYLTEKEYTILWAVHVVMAERNVALFKRIYQSCLSAFWVLYTIGWVITAYWGVGPTLCSSGTWKSGSNSFSCGCILRGSGFSFPVLV